MKYHSNVLWIVVRSFRTDSFASTASGILKSCWYCYCCWRRRNGTLAEIAANPLMIMIHDLMIIDQVNDLWWKYPTTNGKEYIIHLFHLRWAEIHHRRHHRRGRRLWRMQWEGSQLKSIWSQISQPVNRNYLSINCNELRCGGEAQENGFVLLANCREYLWRILLTLLAKLQSQCNYSAELIERHRRLWVSWG